MSRSRVVVTRQLRQSACIVGAALCIGGLFLAIPDTYKSWKFAKESTKNLFGQDQEQISIYRIEEQMPSQGTVFKIVQGQSQRKITGLVLLFFGGNLAWYFGQALADEFEIIEKRCFKIRQSEFLIEDTTLRSGTEVHQTMIEMDMLNQLAYYQKGFRPDDVTYLPPDVEETEDSKGGETEKFPETVNGFFMWLLEKGITQATVRDISRKWFNDGHLSADKVRAFVDGLVAEKLAEWIGEEKNEFKLVTAPRSS